MAELTIEVWTPRVDTTFLVDCDSEATLLLADLNVMEVDTVHADLLRGAKHSELPRTPHYQLVHVGQGR